MYSPTVVTLRYTDERAAWLTFLHETIEQIEMELSARLAGAGEDLRKACENATAAVTTLSDALAHAIPPDDWESEEEDP